MTPPSPHRKNLSDLIEEPAEKAINPQQVVAGAPPAASPRRRAPRAKRPARPAARDLVSPARPVIAREALKADVPAELELLRRLRAYRNDKGVDIRDQVALAVDEWLTREGY